MIRSVRVLGPAVLLLVAFVTLIVSLELTGGAEALALRDSGPIVRWGLPIAKVLVNVSAAVMIGALFLACWALIPGKREYDFALDIASAGAAVFTVASGATAFFIFLDASGSPLEFTDQFGASFGLFLTEIELGQAWLLTTLMAATLTILCFAVRNQTALVFVTIAAGASLIPMANQGHAAGSAGHATAVSALGVHLAFAAVWLGGLVTIVLLRSTLDGRRLPIVLARYSSVALVSFVAVTLSGYVSAAIRLGSFDELSSPYGMLVLVKVGALLALGVFGAVQRRFWIARITDGVAKMQRRSADFWALIVAELAFMGIATGAAAALARTATPVDQTPASELPAQTPASILTGEALPPWPDLYRYFTEWNIDLVWVLACGFGIFFYLAGVWRLHRRGDKWSILRTVSWVSGLLLLAYITNGGIAVYEQFLFSAHMLGHMGLTMAVPVLLVPGAPVTLAARAIRKRTDGTRGGREWILLAVHSRFAGIIANPLVAAGLFVGSLWVFYYSPLFRWTVEDHIGHEWMIIHFLITGYLFVQSLIGIDPVPYRLPYPFRLLLLLGTMAFHAFFGLTIMMTSGLFLADWYGAMGWGTDALLDQQVGGGIAWSVGELPTLALAIAVAVQWAKNDEKETRRSDRNAQRTGDADLEAYNAQLAALAKKDR